MMGTKVDKTPAGIVVDARDRLARVEKQVQDLYVIARALRVVVQDLQKQVNQLEGKGQG